MEDKDLYWLAGLLEGEGYFHPQTEKYSLGIALDMTDQDVVDRVANLLGVKYYKIEPRKLHHKPSYKLALRGRQAKGLMEKLLPLMGNRRSSKIRDAIDSYHVKTRGTLSEDDHRTIRLRAERGDTAKQIAENYPVTHWRIYQVIREEI